MTVKAQAEKAEGDVGMRKHLVLAFKRHPEREWVRYEEILEMKR